MTANRWQDVHSSCGTLHTEIKIPTLHVRNVLLSHHESLLFMSSDSRGKIQGTSLLATGKVSVCLFATAE
jgi:hypothetical protein